MARKKFKFKISQLILLITIIASRGAAQISGNSEIPGTEFSLAEITNLLLFWDLGSGAGFYTGLVMFIATWLGFYFATRPLLLEVYGLIIDNFPTSDNHRSWSTNDDGEPLGMKGLALTSSFVTAQVVGQFFGLVPMIALGGIGLIVFLYSMFKGTQSFRDNFSNAVTGGGTDQENDNRTGPRPSAMTGPDRGTTMSDNRAGDDIQDANERAEDGQDNLDEAGDEINESESDVENGNLGDADREAKAAAQHIERVVKDIEIAEEDLMDAFGRVQNQVHQTLEELEHTTKIAENEEEIIQRISILPREVNQFVNSVEDEADSDIPTEQDLISPEQFSKIQNLYNESEEISLSLDNLIEEIHEESEEEAEEERELLTELKELIEIHKLIKDIGQEIKLSRKEDEELEKIAEKLKDSDLYNEIETEENQERQLLDQLQQLESQEEVIENNIKKADKLITHIISLDSEELQQLQGEDNEYQRSAERIKMYLRTLERNSMDEYEQDGLFIGEIVETLYDKLKEIDGKIERAGKMKQDDSRKAEQMKNELESLIQEL